MNWPDAMLIAPIAVVCALAFTIEAALGFGATLVTVALGSFFLDLDVLLPAIVPLNLVLSSYLALGHRTHIDRTFLMRRLLPFMALGLPVGMYAFTSLDASMLKRLFGTFLVGVSALELQRMHARAPMRELGTWWERALLIAGGALHGAFATGGPMAVYVTSRVLDDKNTYRATLSALWVILNTVMLASYLWRGELDADVVGISACLVPSTALGMVLGEVLHERVPVATFRVVVYVLLALAGVALLVRG